MRYGIAGVFCVSIKKILSIASDFLQDVTYRNLYSNYSLLPNISFDYQVVEKAEKVFVVPFNGCWKDLGTGILCQNKWKQMVWGIVFWKIMKILTL